MADTSTCRLPQEGPAAWRPSDLAASEWTIVLDDDARVAIVTATRAALAAGATVTSLRREQFPLPTLTDQISRWSRALADGRGFLLLRGFPIDLLDEHETELAYIGLGHHLGRPVSQNSAGEVLTHIIDERLPADGPKVRLYRTNERQDFHTDGADIIGLLCLNRARSGGESRIVSSAAIYNAILERRPDLLEVLHRPMHWDRQGDHGAGEPPWFTLAPIFEVGGVPRIFYLGWYIRDAQQHPEVPRLTDDQVAAMELLESLADDPTFHLEMDFEPGDVQLLNNARILHAREAYEDHEDPALRRHLLRLWLAAHTFAGLEERLREGISPAER